MAYEEGSSTLSSPSIIMEREHEAMYKLDLFSGRAKMRSRHTGRQMRDLMEISKACESAKPTQWKLNESVADAVLAEGTDSEFDALQPMIDGEAGLVGMMLNEDAKKELQLQKLKRMYRELTSSKIDKPKTAEEFESKSLLESTEKFTQKVRRPEPLQVPTILSNILQVTHPQPIRPDVEETKTRTNLGSMKISLDGTSEKYVPHGINDTFLPERWNLYNSLYKHQSRPLYKQGKRI